MLIPPCLEDIFGRYIFRTIKSNIYAVVTEIKTNFEVYSLLRYG